MHVVAHSFNEAYNKLANLIRDNPEYVCSPRGMQIKEVLGASFKITNPRDRCIFNPARKFKPQYVVAEALWYLSGNDSTEWISHYAPFWKNISDDGVTANSAYGARMFRPHDRIANGRMTQWDWVKNELHNDPNSRRAIIHLKTATDSIDAKLDVPCTLALQFLVRDQKLHMVTSMRSSDLILGIANDIPAFTLFQELLALELGLDLGDYIHNSNSLHVYERHWDMLDKLCDKDSVTQSEEAWASAGPNPKMPSKPPITQLLKAEDELRQVQDPGSIMPLIEAHAVSLHSYWRDWLLALGSHQAKLLGDNELANVMIRQTYFTG